MAFAPHLCAQTYSDVLRRTQTYSIYSCRVLEHPHLCAQTGASRAFRACVGQADAQGASCQAATRPLSLESLWSEQKELKVKGLESLWSEKKELKELKVKCGWPAAGLRQSNICGWPAAGLRQSNMLEKLHKTQSPRRFQHTLYCTRTHTHTAPHTHPASPKQAAAYTHRPQCRPCTRTHTQKQKQKHTQKQRAKRARLYTHTHAETEAETHAETEREESKAANSSIQFDPVRSSSIRPRRACETLGGLPDRGREELVEERDVARCCAPAYTNLSLAT